MKKAYFILSVFVAIAMLSCNNTNTKEPKTSGSDSLNTKKAVVYYFHGDRRCKTCIAVGEIAEKSVKENFKGNTEVAFKEVNTDLKENAAIAEKFQVSGSSLALQFNNNGKEVIEDITEFAFMYALTNPDTLKNTIVGKIKKHL
jgi:hypothetical protein